jgi:hypothetical protein
MQNLNDPYTRAKLQVNFIDFVLVPWWKGVSRIWPGISTLSISITSIRSFIHPSIHISYAREILAYK